MSQTPESKLWSRFKRAVTWACPGAYVTRVENIINDGHPDVEYILDGRAGTVELKYLSAWPKRAATPVKLRHFTQQQRDDLKARYKAGGRAFVLLQVADEFLLYCMPVALLIGDKPREVMVDLAAGHWANMLDGAALVAALRQ